MDAVDLLPIHQLFLLSCKEIVALCYDIHHTMFRICTENEVYTIFFFILYHVGLAFFKKKLFIT